MAKSMKSHALDLYEKFSLPIQIILYVVFIIPVLFVGQIPKEYRGYANNIIVKIILFGLIILVNNYISYIHALLFAMFVVLYISLNPGSSEAFEDLRIVARKERRWFDEQVIGEDPKLMETEKVRTEAVQSS